MNDSLKYLKEDPIHRQYHHHLLTFSLMYAFSENYLLPISHDEVVHGKGSLLRKAPGSRYDQLATVRAFLAYIWSHPGKQLLFMGTEFAQEAEWADGRQLDWWLLDHAAHYRVHNLVKELNRVYREQPGAVGAGLRPGRLRVAQRRRQRVEHLLLPAIRHAGPRRARSSPWSSTSAAWRATRCGSACRAPATGRSSSTPAATTSSARRARPRSS